MLPERLLGRPRRCAHRVLRPPFGLGRPHSHMCRLLPSPPSPPRVCPGIREFRPAPGTACRDAAACAPARAGRLSWPRAARAEPRASISFAVHAQHACYGRTAPAAGVFRCMHAPVNSFRVMLPGQPHPQLPFEWEARAAHLRHTQGQWGHCGDIRVWWPGRNRLMAAGNGSSPAKPGLNKYREVPKM